MAANPQSSEQHIMHTSSRPRLLDSLRQLLATLVSIVETRIGVLATDLQEARGHFAVLVLVAAFSALSFAMALVLGVLFVVALFWDSYRLMSIGGLIVLFIVIGTALWLAVSRRAKAARELFAQTRAEFRLDGERLRRREARQ